MDIGYLPDPFGHIGQMPQILQGFGIEMAAFRRGLADEPCELWWQAPDGSRVLTAYLRDGYDNAARLPTTPSVFIDFIRERRDSLAPHSAVAHLLLLNGTDHHEPQPEVPALVESMTLDDDRMLISTLPGYLTAVLNEIEADDIPLPVVHGELRDPKRHHLLAGVLSSRTWIKQTIRQGLPPVVNDLKRFQPSRHLYIGFGQVSAWLKVWVEDYQRVASVYFGEWSSIHNLG